MASFPNLSTGTPARYPASCATEYATGIASFADGSEQRWKARAPLVRWTLGYSDLSSADMETLWTFFQTCKGAFDATWDITISGVTYSYCAFDGDSFDVSETAPFRYSVNLAIRQVRKS